jgi:hypothetical protein
MGDAGDGQVDAVCGRGPQYSRGCDCNIEGDPHCPPGSTDPENTSVWRDVAAAFAAACRVDEFGDVFDTHHGDLTGAYRRWLSLERRDTLGGLEKRSDAPDLDAAPRQP